ncbi:MAG TPA: DNA mismatch repair protein MutS [Gammaproteobacteria bacterium]|nr:DNA mismatch repair protein MutS [Gammaproteobacteria bacterium]
MGKDKDNDAELFRQMMAGVKPLSAEERVAPPTPRASAKPRQTPARPPSNAGFAIREHVPDVAPEEALFFARSGLQTRLLHRLKRGELRPEARLDLHGLTIAEAGAQLMDFLGQSQIQGLRCVCVVHGKGHRSAEGRPVLKAQINQWLRDMPEVLAFATTLPKDGGAGAMYILLRRQ